MPVATLTAYPLPRQLDRERIALGEPISTIEVTDIAERPHYLYGVGGRRCLLVLPVLGDVETTSTSFVTVTEVYASLATTRDEIDFVIYGTNVDVRISVEQPDGTSIGSATISRSTEGENSFSLVGITPLPNVLIRCEIKVPTSGTASLEVVRVLEADLTASELP